MADGPKDEEKDSTVPEVSEGAEQTTGSAARADADLSASGDAGNRKKEKGGAATWVWVFGIISVLTLELYIYGHAGWIRVCIGEEGTTDSALLDKQRTQGAARGFPICVE